MIPRRRREFLQVLVDAVRQEGGPVHYEEVAKRMSVSKWTAYDMMRLLLDEGLVTSTYSTSPSAFKGRSQVLFEPTPGALELLQPERGEGKMGEQESRAEASGWQELVSSLMAKTKIALDKNLGPEYLLKDIHDLAPLGFCATLLCTLIVQFEKSKLDWGLLQAVMLAADEPASTLPLLTGILVGGLVLGGAAKLAPGFGGLVERLLMEMSRLGESREGLLMDFAKRVMASIRSR